MVEMNEFANTALSYDNKQDLPIKHIDGPMGVHGRNSNSKELQDSTPRVERIWYATIQSSRAIAPICNIKLHRSPKLTKLIKSSKDGKGGGDDTADDGGGKGEQRFSIAHVRRETRRDAGPFRDDLMAEKD